MTSANVNMPPPAISRAVEQRPLCLMPPVMLRFCGPPAHTGGFVPGADWEAVLGAGQPLGHGPQHQLGQG